MRNISVRLWNYFRITGILLHLLFLILLGYLLFALAKANLPLPSFAQKLKTTFVADYPSAEKFVSELLNPIILLKSSQQYNYIIDPLNWQGVGANKKQIQPVKGPLRYATTATELQQALHELQAGEVLLLSPGTYEISERRLLIANSGTPSNPITVMAEQLGEVKLKLKGEGLLVNQPHWIFKNLHIIGNCSDHVDCEHAFHIVGRGEKVHIHNNILQDFNAAIKVNGINDDFPDGGLVTENTIFNTSVRQTESPVTPIDLMHANDWLVSRNFIFDFIKGKGNKISYGAFFKGGSSNGKFSANLVMCRGNLVSESISVGLSLGGGGSPEAWRRNQEKYEHKRGEIQNNIIMNCANDVGIYVNLSPGSKVHNNILYNTQGIDVRFENSGADVVSNILSGSINSRNGGSITQHNNIVLQRTFFTADEPLNAIFVAPSSGNFQFKDNFDRPLNEKTDEIIMKDFCGRANTTPYIGAFSGDFCLEAMNLKNKNRVFK